MSDNNNDSKGNLEKIIKIIPELLKATKESIQHLKGIYEEFIPAESFSDEQIDKYVKPFYEQLNGLKGKLEKHDLFDLKTDIKQYVDGIDVPKTIKKAERRWNALQSLIDSMEDLSKQLINLCLGVCNEALRGYSLPNINLSSDLVKQLANYALFPTEKSINAIMKPFEAEIKSHVNTHLMEQGKKGAQLKIEVDKTVSELRGHIVNSLNGSINNISLNNVLQSVRNELNNAAKDLFIEVEKDMKKLEKVWRKQNLNKDE